MSAVRSLLLLFAVVIVSQGSAAAAPVRILAFGDSLTAGYGLDDLSDAFPAQLERALKARGHDVELIPGGISGDTTTGGLNRIDWSLGDNPDAVIIELGGNDGLRAVDPSVTERSLDGLIARVTAAGKPVLLAGMMAPPNLGRDYADRFNAIFPRLAQKHGVLFYPFFLDGVAGIADLNQGDRIHPTPRGVAVIVARILPQVEKLIAQVKQRRGA